MNSSSANKSGTFDVLVVGAGPAGIAAACCAAEGGARVGVIDSNARVGGQIWRGETLEHSHSAGAQLWFEKFAAHDIEVFPCTEVIDQVERGHLVAQCGDTAREFIYEKLILCTGARELFLPFPGWTLPNVMGAGGLQALVKSGFAIAGKRVAVAGSGPLLLAVAAYLHDHGADVRLIAEQAPWRRIARFGMALLREKNKFTQAMAIRRQLAGVPYRTNCWPIRADGHGKLESVTLRSGAKTWQEPCDYLACGFHLVPNTELASLLGCELRGGFVRVDDLQQSSVKEILCAGELTGIAGVDSSILEGQIAAYTAAGQAARTTKLLAQKRRMERFAISLRQTFALRKELRASIAPETIVCRCEDVQFARLRPYPSWRAAKLQTRCGMGPCQGRICGPATEFLFGWKADSVRPPVFAASIQTFTHSALFSPVQNLISHKEPR